MRIHELATGINVALDRMGLDRCPPADANADSRVEISELVAGVDAALYGCDKNPPTPTPESRPSQQDLDAARARWASAGFTHYEYRYNVSCFCPGPHDVVIEVIDDKVVDTRDPENGQPVTVQIPGLLFTVPQLFDRIQSELETADTLRVDFDPDTGHPIEYYVDPVTELADEELWVRITNLQPVDNSCSSAGECDGFAEICIEPGGFIGCGVCFPAMSECEADVSCGGNAQICEPIGLSAQSCACDPSVLVCKPGCQSDAECAPGTACAPDHRCVPVRCNSDESCPPQFVCRLPPDSRTGECLRRSCTSASDCADAGYCVEQQCYTRPGRCEIIPP